MSNHGPPPAADTANMQVVSEVEVRQLALNAAKLLPQDATQVDSSNLSALLFRIIHTANVSSISLAHRGAACNLLSTLISQADAHNSWCFKSLLWKDEIWVASFKFVLARFSDSKPKPMKQLLGTLITVLKTHRSNSAAQPSHAWLCSELSSVLKLPSGSAPTKAHLYALTTALNKGAVRLQDVLDGLSDVRTDSELPTAHPFDLESRILSWTSHDELGPSLASLLAAILQVNGASSTDSWYQPLINRYTGNLIVQSCYRHYILPAIFAKNFLALAGFLVVLDLDSCFGEAQDHEMRAELAISTILVASSAGFVHIDPATSSARPNVDSGRIVLPLPWLDTLSTLRSNVARIGSLTFLVGQPSTIEPFHPNVLRLFLRQLPIMFADTDADFRSDLLSLVQRIVDRVRAASNALSRKNDSRLDDLVSFFRQWLMILKHELRPSASYQRHVCALQCLRMLVQSGIDPSIARSYLSKAAKSQHQVGFQTTLFDRSTQPVLLALLLDPFDDVRSLAMMNLQALGTSETGDQTTLEVFVNFLGFAEQQSAKSGRADHADGVARAYALLYSIAPSKRADQTSSWWASKQSILNRALDTYEQILSAAQKNMADAVQGRPLHSTIISLRYIVDSTSQTSSGEPEHEVASTVSSRIMMAIESTWKTVRHVLCDEAPEGFVTDDADEEEADMDSKSILSFCWRALREASLLQRALIVDKSAALSDRDTILPTFQQHMNICFTQLIELRHRGAFSTVAQTFLACCGQFVRLFPQDQTTIPIYYSRIITSIRNTSTINTRRSAGLPAALAGILAASESPDLFTTAVGDLITIARETASFPIQDHQALPQVHALNCLRELFKHSKLGQRSEEYIPRSLLLAGQCLTSDLWGIRNSGLMLFRSLIDRLLGTNDSYEDDVTRSRSKDLLVKFPELLDLVINLLDNTPTASANSSVSVEKVFPALQILQRVSPPTEKRVQVCQSVAALTSSPHWHVRDKAARAFARLQSESNLEISWQQCISWETKTENARHGQLLTLRYLLGYHQTLKAETTQSLAESITDILNACTEQSSSEVVSAVAVDLWCDLINIIASTSNDGWQPILAFTQGVRLRLDKLLDTQARCDFTQVPRPKSLLVRSLAQAMLFDETITDSRSSNISWLETADQDSCASLFNRATALCNRPNTDISMIRILIERCLDLLGRNTISNHPSVHNAAVRLLIEALSSYREELINDKSLNLPSVQDLLSLNTSPLLYDGALILASIVLDIHLVEASTISSLPPHTMQQWISLLKDAAHEDNPFDTRLASAVAASKLHNGLGILAADPQASESLIDLALLVYDQTNDDDDEIRDIAASTAARLFSPKPDLSQPTVPLEVSSALLRRLMTHHSNNRHLFTAVVQRLATVSNPSSPAFAPLRTVLSAASSQETALFAREKQNLFIDPGREAKVWSQLVRRMGQQAVDPAVVEKLQIWALEGMRVLTQQSQADGANGPLGWGSFSGDVFALTLSVIYAVDVLLDLRKKWRLSLVRAEELRESLVGVVQEAKRCGGCPLLVTEGEKVLVADLERGMARVGALLGGILA